MFLAQITYSVWSERVGSPGSSAIEDMRGPVSRATHWDVFLSSGIEFSPYFCLQKAALPINSPMDMSGSKVTLAICVSYLFSVPMSHSELPVHLSGLKFLLGVAMSI